MSYSRKKHSREKYIEQKMYEKTGLTFEEYQEKVDNLTNDFLDNMRELKDSDGKPYFNDDYLLERFKPNTWKRKKRDEKIDDILD